MTCLSSYHHIHDADDYYDDDDGEDEDVDDDVDDDLVSSRE